MVWKGLGEPEMESESLGRVSEKLDMKAVVVGKVHRSVNRRSCWKRLLLTGTAAVLGSAMGSLARPKLSQKSQIAFVIQCSSQNI